MGCVIGEYFMVEGVNDSSAVDWKYRKEIVQEKETLWQSEPLNEKRVVPGGIFALSEEKVNDSEWGWMVPGQGCYTEGLGQTNFIHITIHITIPSTLYDVSGILRVTGLHSSYLFPQLLQPYTIIAPTGFSWDCPLVHQAGAAAGQVLGSASYLLTPTHLSHFCFWGLMMVVW